MKLLLCKQTKLNFSVNLRPRFSLRKKKRIQQENPGLFHRFESAILPIRIQLYRYTKYISDPFRSCHREIDQVRCLCKCGWIGYILFVIHICVWVPFSLSYRHWDKLYILLKCYPQRLVFLSSRLYLKEKKKKKVKLYVYQKERKKRVWRTVIMLRSFVLLKLAYIRWHRGEENCRWQRLIIFLLFFFSYQSHRNISFFTKLYP